MVHIDSGNDVFPCSVCIDFRNNAEKFLADKGGVFGFEVLLNEMAACAGLLQSWDVDRRGGCGFELRDLAEDGGLFLLQFGEAFTECVGVPVFGERVDSVANALSDGSKLGGV